MKIKKALRSKAHSSHRLKLIIVCVVFIFSLESAGHCLRVPIADGKRIYLAYSRIAEDAFEEIDRKTKEV